jgi:hypothetical protein
MLYGQSPKPNVEALASQLSPKLLDFIDTLTHAQLTALHDLRSYNFRVYGDARKTAELRDGLVIYCSRQAYLRDDSAITRILRELAERRVLSPVDALIAIVHRLDERPRDIVTLDLKHFALSALESSREIKIERVISAQCAEHDCPSNEPDDETRVAQRCEMCSICPRRTLVDRTLVKCVHRCHYGDSSEQITEFRSEQRELSHEARSAAPVEPPAQTGLQG